MAFVFWKTRYDAFVKKYDKVDFETLARAMHEPGGWGSISGNPDWGFFKFAHTHPAKSNSGLITLVLTAYELAGKQRGLTIGDVTRPAYQEWLTRFEHDVARPGGVLSHSTGTLMKDMVLRGPTQYDGLILYENLAIDYMKAAEEHWGKLHIVYPEPNLWNEHPYYILDVPWSDVRQKELAADFLRFLLSEPIQREALKHGFRPGNPAVSARGADNPITRLEEFGFRHEVPRMAEPPRAEVVDGLLSLFRRIEP
jgi:Ca-activated chloride channel family protein